MTLLMSPVGAAAGTGLDAETLKMTLEAIRDYISDAIPEERQLQLDREDVCPEDLVRAMCSDELGIQLLFIPEEYGGMGGGTFDVYRVCEPMARIDLGLATSVLATFLGSDPILVGGTPEQKKRVADRIAEEGLLFAYGATEPEAGSDLAALKTTATPVEDDGRSSGYRHHRAQAVDQQRRHRRRVHDPGHRARRAVAGSSSSAARQGFTQDKPEDKHGIRLSNTAALFLDDVSSRPSNLVGGVEGQGLVQAQQVFGYTRLMVAAFGLGRRLGRAGPRHPVLHRAHPGRARRCREKQGYTHKLIVPHAVRLEAARAYIEETAERIDAGEGATAPSTPRAPSPSTWPPRPATPPPTPRSRPTAATATRASTWSRRSSATFGSPRSTRAPPRSWR